MTNNLPINIRNQSASDGLSVLPWDIEAIVSGLREARSQSLRVAAAANRRTPIPSPELLQHGVNRLYASLFPRHAGAVDHSEEGLAYFVGSTLNEALLLLVEQIRREHGFVDPERRLDGKNPRSAEGIVADFASGLPK
ncbi:MAG TPA: serine acetyltransferase, partial [Hyphomicrobium sp.]|nr:serine acetyltransferase [Hyphomicrobium sp.]